VSAYVTLGTPMTERECLLAALAAVGFGAGVVEVHPEPVPLVGYEGSRRAQTADVVVRRRHLGGSSNDLGFLRTPTGYRAIVSRYDRTRFGDAWLRRLEERYREHDRRRVERLEAEERRRAEEARRRLVEAQRRAVGEQAERLGYRVREEQDGETVRLVLVKRVYG